MNEWRCRCTPLVCMCVRMSRVTRSFSFPRLPLIWNFYILLDLNMEQFEWQDKFGKCLAPSNLAFARSAFADMGFRLAWLRNCKLIRRLTMQLAMNAIRHPLGRLQRSCSWRVHEWRELWYLSAKFVNRFCLSTSMMVIYEKAVRIFLRYPVRRRLNG